MADDLKAILTLLRSVQSEIASLRTDMREVLTRVKALEHEATLAGHRGAHPEPPEPHDHPA